MSLDYKIEKREQENETENLFDQFMDLAHEQIFGYRAFPRPNDPQPPKTSEMSLYDWVRFELD